LISWLAAVAHQLSRAKVPKAHLRKESAEFSRFRQHQMSRSVRFRDLIKI